MSVVVGSVLMVLWDVALDPAMSFGFPVWNWEVEGIFYGMPLINFVGWFVTSVVIIGGYWAIHAAAIRAPRAWAEGVWLLSAALPLGICVVRGMGWGLLFGTAAILAPLVLVRSRRIARRARPASPRWAT